MASRAEQKAAARAEREAAQQAHSDATKQRQRLWIVGGVLGIAIVVIVVAIVASSSKSGPKTGIVTKPAAQTALVKQVNSELAGIPQQGFRLGSPSAKVTIAYYGDLECPICRDFTLNTLPQVIANDVSTNRAQIVYHSLETASQGNPDPNAFKNQQIAAEAAGLQQKGWNYIELFYNQQGQEDTQYVTESYLDQIAQQSGLSYNTWLTDRNVAALASQITQDGNYASQQGWTATPTFYISGPKGTPQVINGAVPYSTIEAAVKSVS